MSEQYQRGIDMDTTPEIKEALKVMYLGRLGDFGLGNPEGIPSRLADKSEAELKEYGESLKEKLVDVTDRNHLACIDGRCILCNADGSEPEVRLRHVSGTGANVEVAFNAESPVIDTLPEDASMGQIVSVVDEHIERTTGFKRSAHLGGCGGVNGAAADNEAIATKQAILDTAVAIINLPEVSEYLNVSCDENDAHVATVRAQAGSTSQMMLEKGWNGQRYVEGVVMDNPQGVSDLETKEDTFKGHAEDDILLILGEKTVAEKDHFVANLTVGRELAASFAGQHGEAGYKKAVIADVGKHLATADRLASTRTPVFLIFSK